MFLEQHNGSVELMTEGGRRNGPVAMQLCWILSWHSKDNRFFSTRGNTCRQGTDVATSSMPWTSMCQGLGSVYCPLCVCVCLCVWTHFSRVNSLWPYGLLPPFVMGILREYWSGWPCLLQGIFPTQGSNLCLLQPLHCRWVLYCWATGEAHTAHYLYLIL